MEPIEYSERNFKAIISKTTLIGEKFPGMRDDKPFLHNGEILINIKKQLHKVDEIKFLDESENEITLKDVSLDTGDRIAAVIIKDGKVLLQHRVKNDREYYVFPGGHKTTKETETEALSREVEEELGIIVLGKPEFIYEYQEEGYGKELFYLINEIEDYSTLLSQNPDTKPGEINEPVFLTLEEALKIDLFPKEIIQILQKK